MPPPQKFIQLFVQANYKFSSVDPTRPLTTLYFTDLQGNHGRYRRAHGGGAVLVYQGRCGRLFVSPNFMQEVSAAAELEVELRTADWDVMDNVLPHLCSRLAKIYEQVRIDPAAFAGKASLTPKTGWHLFDWKLDRETAHGSNGVVLLADPQTAAYFQANPNLNGYAGVCVDWD
jgi:hypothetical protein